ncbi:Lrp/AsnC family transcriptional regulator [Alicyclobacillus fastidiosus]|uniref:Lrp/AsnC family transcriptional regulator n=1 Tax=Alicyclobacillus fastidiosus TaxID=392011 RepID=A0ABV5ABT8_9BACL|nr:Lrp/AsnC family transcriptional regulator [Alicyclobacillus fastidiosus]WEH10306.1 Lrp/AsnC family transcriptional regulator [Alicyclobacillus fastidiosus]
MFAELDGIDEVDLNIIKFLQEDGRMSYREIADQIGVAERTVRLRVAQLRNNDILQIVGVVNPIQVGLKMVAAIQISVAPQQLNTCIETLQEMPEVRFVALTSGEYHLMVEVVSRSHEELGDFIQNRLNRITGVEKTNVIMELKILKNQFKFVR